MSERPIEFDREGNPISIEDYAKLHQDREYVVVKQDHINHWLVSTVWLGVDYGFGYSEKPLIFETMIFDQSEEGLRESAEVHNRARKSAKENFGIEIPERDPDDVGLGPEAFCKRYSTEDEALQGHREALLACRAGLIVREGEEVSPEAAVRYAEAIAADASKLDT